MGIGEQSSVSTQTQDIAQIFNNWKSFGDGTWGYDTTNKWIYNTKNSSYFTGYYNPDGNYDSIELSFEAKTTDGDDDMIGSMIRFNADSSSTYSSYLFLLDRHDNGGGIGNGAYNGITKLNNNSFVQGNLTKLSVNPNIIWTRNTWQSYKFTAKGSTIEAYLDGTKVASTTDTSITSGSYGFVSYSQAYTYFRNITVTTLKTNTLAELVNSKTWQTEQINIVINYNNSLETLLQDTSCVDLFINNNIHYIGVGNDTNKSEIEQFIINIGNNGTFTQSSNIENATTEISDYIAQALK